MSFSADRKHVVTPLRRTLVLTGGALLATFLAGCSAVSPACSMPDIRPPHITVDTSIWLRLHPGGTVHACYAGSCDHENGTGASFEILVPREADLGKEHDLVVTMRDQSGTTTQTVRMKLDEVPGQKGAPCPMPNQWSRKVLITTDGQLQVGGVDDGHLIVPTSTQEGSAGS